MKRAYDFSKARRGAVLRTPPGKTRITIRIDDDVLDWFRAQVHAAGGGNYQTMMNRALREWIEKEDEPLETTLRRVLREVLPGSRRLREPRKPRPGATKRRS
jgi:hypothetical protein